ncbi:MAG: hypothetical protein AAGE59_04235 [Cyanobacteria bacterium P01_F01_bin.86]
MNSSSTAEKPDQERPWLLLSNLVGVTKLVDILQENTAPNTDVDEIAHSAVGMVEGDLLVIDFNTPALCGRGGCAIAAYQVSTGEQLLFTYATQPAGEPIVELTERSGAELPCLLIAPPINTTAQGLTRDTLCYQDGEWVTEGA